VSLYARLALLAAAVLAVLAIGWKVHHSGVQSGRAEIRAEWDAQIAVQMQAAAKEAEANARETFRRLEVGAEAERKRNAQVASLNARLADALGELRNRPERPAAASGPAGNPPAGASCTGAGLYRPDAEFLVREAARADRILAERDYCHDRYEALTPGR
jgi:hypothetical protein